VNSSSRRPAKGVHLRTTTIITSSKITAKFRSRKKVRKMGASESDPNRVLKVIYDSFIPIETEQKKQNTQLIQQLIKGKTGLVQHLKDEDPIFECLFQEVYHSGSYYDGLRVSNPDEFDLNFKLKLPIHHTSLVISDAKCAGGYARLGSCDASPPSMLIEKTNKCFPLGERLERELFEKDCDKKMWHLRPDKTRSWLESLITKVVDKMKGELGRYGVRKITPRKAGPSMNLEIIMALDGRKVDVDLVPVIACHPQQVKSLKGIAPEIYKQKTKWEKTGFTLVPKPPSKIEKGREREWRLDFHEQESDLIEGEVKPIIKLLKAFRDKNSNVMGKLYSYALKTSVMDMMRATGQKKLDPGKRADSFLKALDYLHAKLDSGNLPHIFLRSYNLLSKFKSEEVKNMARWLATTIRKLRDSANTPQCKTVWSKAFGLERLS